MHIHPDSFPIEENVQTTFEGVYYRRGISKTTNSEWRALSIRFKINDLMLQTMLFEPPFGDYIKNREFGSILKELLNTLSGVNMWDTIPKFKNSWDAFYEQYVQLIKPYRNTKCYIKTLAQPHWQDKDYAEAILAKNNFISLHNNLEYTILEENLVSNYIDMDEDKTAYKQETRNIIF